MRGVNEEIVSDWTKKFGNLCEGYQPKDIFNMDETGVVFKDVKKSLHIYLYIYIENIRIVCAKYH